MFSYSVNSTHFLALRFGGGTFSTAITHVNGETMEAAFFLLESLLSNTLMTSLPGEGSFSMSRTRFYANSAL
jgi:hypothetical protein